jgi:hypothetical protein
MRALAMEMELVAKGTSMWQVADDAGETRCQLSMGAFLAILEV